MPAKKEGDYIPCPHYNVRIIGRSRKHASAVASAAYQSGEKLYSQYDKHTKDYSGRRERVVYTEILLPDHVPRKYLDRATLWNSVEMNEKQSNAQYARRFVIALPKELSDYDNMMLIKEYCQEQFASKGMCVDLAIHNDGDGNPHAHILTTMRAMDEQGNWMPKSRKEYILDENGNRIKLSSGEWKSKHVSTTDWDDRGNVEKWRHAWEKLQNAYLKDAGRSERIDMRSYERQGVDTIPTIHLGPEASAMERRGVHSFLGDINREIGKQNRIIAAIKNGIEQLKSWIEEYKDRKQLRHEEEIAKGPPILGLLCDYINIRIDEREGWNSKYSLKGLTKDMINFSEARHWLEQHGVSYANDFLKQLHAMEDRRSAAAETLRKNAARRKTIAKIEAAADVIEEKQPIVDAYYHIHFQTQKEQFAAEHADDLQASKRAYAFLMNNHDGKLEVEYGEFKRELEQMEYADEMAQDELAAIKDDLTMLRKIKRYVTKADPDLEQERQDAEQSLEQARQQFDEQHKKTKKHEQTR